MIGHRCWRCHSGEHIEEGTIVRMKNAVSIFRWLEMENGVGVFVAFNEKLVSQSVDLYLSLDTKCPSNLHESKNIPTT